MFNRDRPDRLERSPSDRVAFSARLVMYDIRWESVVLDCVAGEDHRLILGDHELASGEPFSLEVELPGDGWLTAALVTLDRWAGDGRPLVVALVVQPEGVRMRLGDGTTVLQFDLLGVMGRRPRY